MTDQIFDKLVVEYPSLALDDWRLYGVITGDPSENHGWGQPYPFRNKPAPPPKGMCTALIRGYVAFYKLAGDGHLWLTGYEYPFRELPAELVSELLEGDFWLVLKTQFRAPRMYVPFASSKIVTDPAKWIRKRTS